MPYQGLPPGLGGFVMAQQTARQNALGDLQAQIQVANMQRLQQQAQQEAQLAPLKMQMMQAQLGGLQRQEAQAKALDDLISKLPEQDRVRAMANPRAFFQQQKPMVVGAGGAVVSPTGQEIYKNPAAEKDARTQIEKYLDAAGISDPAQRAEYIRRALEKQVTPGGTNINIPPRVQPMYEPTPGGWRVRDMRTGKVLSPNALPPGAVIDPRLVGRGAYARETGKGAAKDDNSQFNAANDAKENITKLNLMINHMRNSKAVTGLGADLIKQIERVKVFAGGDPSKLSDTELLDAMMGSDVFPMIKTLGIGARGLDTPEERKFLRQVMTGELGMNKNTLIRMAEIRRDIAQRVIDRWNERIKKGEVKEFYSQTGREMKEIDGGTTASQSSDLKNAVEAAGVTYEPDKYDYKVEGGKVLRSKKQ